MICFLLTWAWLSREKTSSRIQFWIGVTTVIFIHVIQRYTVWEGLKKRGTEVAACVLKQAHYFEVRTADTLTVRKCINHIPCQSASWYDLVDVVTHFYAPCACFCFHRDQVVTAFIGVAPRDGNVTSLLLFTCFVILKCHVTKDWSAFLNWWP